MEARPPFYARYPRRLQVALNISLTDLNGQASGPAVLGFPIEQAEVTSYINGEYQQRWLATGVPVADLMIAIRG